MVERIYKRLNPSLTECGYVIIKPVYQKEGIKYAKSIGGIFSMRVDGMKYHFGNPFSSVIDSPELIKTSSTKESVVKYIDWIVNSKVNFYTGDISPSPNTIFVFGSNPEGRHEAGAAKTAKNLFGAEYGIGEGLQGNSYAIPTKYLRVSGTRSISEEDIKKNILNFYKFAETRKDLSFHVAYRNVGTVSLNGYSGLEMINMFNCGVPPSNVLFSEEWVKSGRLLNSRAIWIRKVIKSGVLRGKPIVYYKELREPSHANALDYLINY